MLYYILIMHLYMILYRSHYLYVELPATPAIDPGVHRIGYVGIQSFEVQPADGQDESLPRAMTCWAAKLWKVMTVTITGWWFGQFVF